MQEELLLSPTNLSETLAKLASGLADLIDDPARTALVGVRTRGDVLARRIQENFRRTRGWELPLGIVDITLYRDDLSQHGPNPLIRSTELPFDVDDKTILLIDDVLYTGRTIRSAIDQIIEFGRPRAIKLGVLIDRGLRELPIQADVAGVRIQTKPEDEVKVFLQEQDGRDEVILSRRKAA